LRRPDPGPAPRGQGSAWRAAWRPSPGPASRWPTWYWPAWP